MVVELFENFEQMGCIEEFRKRGGKLETNQIITLISGAGIGAVLSAFLTFINSSKKNKLDFITKERSEGRKDIQVILDGNHPSKAAVPGLRKPSKETPVGSSREIPRNQRK